MHDEKAACHEDAGNVIEVTKGDQTCLALAGRLSGLAVAEWILFLGTVPGSGGSLLKFLKVLAEGRLPT